MKRKALFLELNEFNAELLHTGANQFGLKHLQRLCSMKKTSIWTEDTYESDCLEPWVQWVSVHTGVPSFVHQIKHLGDVPHLEHKQIWELLSQRGISSGIWGAMNAGRGGASLCRFFLPDPWTASEQAYPDELNHLLDPVRYLSKNYLNRSYRIVFKKAVKLLQLFLSNGLGWTLFKEMLKLPLQIAKHGFEPFLFISLADDLSTRLFLEYRKKMRPDFSLIFLNSLAHLQHHHWHSAQLNPNGPIAYGLKVLDRAMGHLFDSLEEGEIFAATNAFSQKNTNDEKPWILYRQIDQGLFLKAVGISFERVEAHMTHDAHIYFSSPEDAARAKKVLKEAKMEGSPLFLVESYPEHPLKIFYRICFTDPVDREAKFTLGAKSFRFFDLFKPIVQRTGKHVPEGTVFCSENLLPERLKNHELLSTLLFGSSSKSEAPYRAAIADRKA